MSRLRWLLARLARMSLLEIAHRFKEFGTKAYLQIRPSVRGPIIREFPAFPIATLIPEPNSLYIANTSLDTMREVTVFGHAWPRDANGHLAWFSFLSGRSTEQQPAFKVDYRSGTTLADDIRFPWELNRLCWLLPVAAAAHGGNDEAADFVLQTTTHFLDTDVPGKSLRWNSAIELSVQSLALLLIDGLLAKHPGWASLRPQIATALHQRTRWIAHLPSKYSSANNHRLAELVALVAISERAFHRCASKAIVRELRNEVRKQFLSDGFNAELSFDYHLFALDLLLLAKLLAPEASAAADLDKYLHAIGVTTARIAQQTSPWPTANDSDEALVLGALVGREAAPAFLARLCGVPEVAASERHLTLPDAGYTLVRGGLHTRAVLVVDHGAIGYGRIAAHGHSDALALWLTVDGRPWLIEAGTFSYHCDEAFRDELRSSHMHNTITIDGVSLSNPLGPFMWNPRVCAEGRLDALIDDGSMVRLQLSAHKRKAIVATREIAWLGDVLSVSDRSCVGGRLESHFVLGPQFSTYERSEPSAVNFRDEVGNSLLFRAAAETTFDVSSVKTSPRFGHLAQSFRISAQSDGHHQVDIKLSVKGPQKS